MTNSSFLPHLSTHKKSAHSKTHDYYSKMTKMVLENGKH